MLWYDRTIQSLKPGKTYTRASLLQCMHSTNPTLSMNSLQWAIGGMVKNGKLIHVGFDKYALPGAKALPHYTPVYSDTTRKLIAKIMHEYPYVQFVAFETVLMNEFLNHLIAQNTVFIQVDKETSIYVFRFLQDKGYQSLMYKPSKKDFDLYWSNGSIVITDLVSESPLSPNNPHSICIEKMLVDMYCDKLIRGTYSKGEFESVMEQALSRFYVERTRLLRYARRRNKESEISHYLNLTTHGE